MVISLALPTSAFSDVHLACVFPELPDTVMSYPEAQGDKPQMRVSGRSPAEMVVGQGSSRFETAEVDGYQFRFSPSNSWMDVSRDGEKVTSEQGQCVLVNGPVNDEPIVFEEDELATGSNEPEKETSDIGDWNVEIDASNFDDTKTVVLSLNAEQEISGRFGRSGRPAMYIRCKENRTVLYLWIAGHFMSDIQGNGIVDLRIDKNKAFQSNMQASTDNEALGLWAGSKAIPLAKSLMEADKLFVRATPHSESPKEFSFKLTGLDAAIKPLREACNW